MDDPHSHLCRVAVIAVWTNTGTPRQAIAISSHIHRNPCTCDWDVNTRADGDWRIACLGVPAFIHTATAAILQRWGCGEFMNFPKMLMLRDIKLAKFRYKRCKESTSIYVCSTLLAPTTFHIICFHRMHLTLSIQCYPVDRTVRPPVPSHIWTFGVFFFLF